MGKVTKSTTDPRDAKIDKLDAENARLKHQVKELQARVRGETTSSRQAWDTARARAEAIITLAEVFTTESRYARLCHLSDDLPF